LSFKYIFPEAIPAEGIRGKRIFNVFQNSTMQVAKRQWGRSWDVSMNFSMSLDKYGNFAQTIPLTAAVDGIRPFSVFQNSTMKVAKRQ
jgi:hypothetical protein